MESLFIIIEIFVVDRFREIGRIIVFGCIFIGDIIMI